MVPIVTQLSADFQGRALVGTVDVQVQTALASRYGVTRVPTFVFFQKGQEVSRQSGVTTYQDLAGKLQALSGVGSHS
ncbi:MAG TPA: thioredoxin family protein [Vicinamibacteria bacterium]|nr:thioredoxin family protein [Vicinamibacteria bacterium]